MLKEFNTARDLLEIIRVKILNDTGLNVTVSLIVCSNYVDLKIECNSWFSYLRIGDILVREGKLIERINIHNLQQTAQAENYD